MEINRTSPCDAIIDAAVTDVRICFKSMHFYDRVVVIRVMQVQPIKSDILKSFAGIYSIIIERRKMD